MTVPPIDPRVAAVRELVRLAEEERRRGISFWFDPELADSLRVLVREAEGGGISPIPAPGLARTTVAVRPLPDHPLPAPAQPQPLEAARPAFPPESFSSPGSGASEPASSNRQRWGPPPPAEGRDADWEAQLSLLQQEASSCRACGLCRTRHSVVFGTGRALVPLVFVGEAPGADEDRQGIPFVGRAGQLLTRIIAAIGLAREDVYICNVIKCRPPENRNPAPDEIASCAPFLQRQLDLLRPKVICTLGLFATQTLLETTAPIGKLRGRLMLNKGMKILPTYHPAALLRNPGLKATVWEDVQLLRRILDE